MKILIFYNISAKNIRTTEKSILLLLTNLLTNLLNKKDFYT